MSLPQADGMLVFRRAIGREGCVILRKCDDHEAGAAGALYDFAAARTDHEMATILPERDLVRRQIVLVAIGIGHIDLGQPISFRHWVSALRSLPLRTGLVARLVKSRKRRPSQ